MEADMALQADDLVVQLVSAAAEAERAARALKAAGQKHEEFRLAYSKRGVRKALDAVIQEAAGLPDYEAARAEFKQKRDLAFQALMALKAALGPLRDAWEWGPFVAGGRMQGRGGAHRRGEIHQRLRCARRLAS